MRAASSGILFGSSNYARTCFARARAGVFFNYELSPMRVRIEERRNSLGHFLTRICAIIGGVFTIMSVVDRVVEGGMQNLAKSRRRKTVGGGLGGGLMKD